jgi:RNA polymerase sigma-70 factor (ECF subfamily)
LARRWGLSSADADDVAQRTLVIAHQRLAEITEGCERAFLFRTAIFLSTKVHRTHRRRPEDSIEDWDEQMGSGPNPEQLLEQRRARAQLDGILSEMPEDLRSVFVLFEIENLSQLEIAEALEIPQGTVASRLRRARETFAALMNHRLRVMPKAGAMP